jgi:hypothetical protein
LYFLRCYYRNILARWTPGTSDMASGLMTVYSPLLGLGRFSVSSSFTQSAGLLRWVISRWLWCDVLWYVVIMMRLDMIWCDVTVMPCDVIVMRLDVMWCDCDATGYDMMRCDCDVMWCDCDATGCHVMRCDCDATGYDMMRCDCDAMWCDVIAMRLDAMWCDVMWLWCDCDAMWCDVIAMRLDAVWCDVMWLWCDCDAVWCDVMWLWCDATWKKTDTRHKWPVNISASSDWPKTQGRLFVLDPVLKSRGNCTDNCSWTVDNSRSLKEQRGHTAGIIFR